MIICPHSGISESEQFLKGTSQIKTLSADDIEGMRVVCKVGISWVEEDFAACVLILTVVCSWLEKFWISQPWWWSRAPRQRRLTTLFIWYLSLCNHYLLWVQLQLTCLKYHRLIWHTVTLLYYEEVNNVSLPSMPCIFRPVQRGTVTPPPSTIITFPNRAVHLSMRSSAMESQTEDYCRRETSSTVHFPVCSQTW